MSDEQEQMQKDYKVSSKQTPDDIKEGELEEDVNKILTRLHKQERDDKDVVKDTLSVMDRVLGFFYKYRENEANKYGAMTAWAMDRIREADNLEDVLFYYNEGRKDFLPRLKEIGFALSNKPKYPWEDKLERAEQIRLDAKQKQRLRHNKKKNR